MVLAKRETGCVVGALGILLLMPIMPVAQAAPGPGPAGINMAVPEGEHGAALSDDDKPGRAKTVILVGNIVALEPDSWTLLVDVRFQHDVLRVGAWMTENTWVSAEGVSARWEDLEPGTRARIGIRRVRGGTEAVSVEVLNLPTG